MTRTISAAVAAPLLAAGIAGMTTAVATGRAQPLPERTFTDRVAVAEATVVIELPRLGKVSPSDFEPDDFVLEVGGVRRPVTAVLALDPAADPRPVLVYVDAVLAKPLTVQLSLKALAAQSRSLLALGPVELVVDDGEPDGPVRRLAATRGQRELAAALRAVAEQGLGRDAYFERTLRPPRLRHGVDVARASADRLLAAARQRCAVPPCFLFWISDGFAAVDPEGAAVAMDLDQGLAARGWIVVAMALHVPSPDTHGATLRPISYEEWKAMTPGVKMAPSGGEVSRLRGLSASSFDFYVEPRYEPLRRVAIASCGAGLRVEHQLEAEFERLQRRLLLRFAAEDDALAGSSVPQPSVLPVKVRLAEVSRFADRRRFKRWLGLVPLEERLHHSRWVLSGGSWQPGPAE